MDLQQQQTLLEQKQAELETVEAKVKEMEVEMESQRAYIASLDTQLEEARKADPSGLRIGRIEIDFSREWFWYPDWKGKLVHYFGFLTVYTYSKSTTK